MVTETRDCFNCGEMGHLSRNFPYPRKPNRGKDRVYVKGGQKGGGRKGGKSSYKANFAMIGEESPERVEVSVAELEELRQLKKRVENLGNKDERTAIVSSASANLAHSNPGKWIIDSGASTHVTGMLDEFKSYTPFSPTYMGTDRKAHV